MTDPVWRVPEPITVCEVELDERSATIVRRHGNPSGRRLLLSHGNGLAIDLYYPFWSLLERDFELFVYDLRNHGWNALGDEEDHNVYSFVADLEVILTSIEAEFGAKPLIGVFHSLSALIALLHSSSLLLSKKIDRKSHGFDALFLFDPPLHRPPGDRLEFDAQVDRNARATRRRTSKFDTIGQYLEILNFFPTFSRFVPGARALMAQSTLKKSESSTGFELRCPPAYEARIHEFVRAFADEADLDQLPCPTRILGADPLLPFSYLPTVDLTEVLSVDFDFLPDTTHYMQVEKPEECAQCMRTFIEGLNLDPVES